MMRPELAISIYPELAFLFDCTRRGDYRFVGFCPSWHLSSVLPMEAAIYSLDVVGVNCVVDFVHEGSYQFVDFVRVDGIR